ncbi:MAG TPA: hypothetical protein VHB50_03350, partial [Bryobacteraceae bacterium]|nr:hypothetical protein [Bryobacteraceae bacterium]
MKVKIRLDSWTALVAMAALAAAPLPQTTPLHHTRIHVNKAQAVSDTPAEKRSFSISISADRSTSVGAKMRLGSVASDAGPSPGALRYSWAAASGPAPVFFAQPSSRSTDAVFSVPGLYVLTLTV